MQRTPTLSPFAGRGHSRLKAVPGDARRHNRSLVLRTLFQSGPLSRADLARATHLTRVTTSDLAAELLAEGLVEELGTRTDQGVGKPAILIGVVRDSRLTVTLDLSEESLFKAALVDLSGKIRDRREATRDGLTGDDAVELATKLAADVAANADGRLLGLGVGSPGVVAPDGVVLEAPNLGWFDLDLARRLGDAIDVPTHVANDANAAALAELSFGQSKVTSFVLVRVDQGVGAGLVLDGALFRGTRSAAGPTRGRASTAWYACGVVGRLYCWPSNSYAVGSAGSRRRGSAGAVSGSVCGAAGASGVRSPATAIRPTTIHASHTNRVSSGIHALRVTQ